MTRCYIALGSNLDNPEQQVKQAMTRLTELDSSSSMTCSSLYRSKPLGPQQQPDFINAVVGLECELPALQLLSRLQGIENDQGRVRAERWGPRSLDLDLLLYGEETIDHPDLKVPHPEMAKRNFVLIPLYEIAAELTIPAMGKLADLIRPLAAGGLERIDGA